jgi:hypothetical protein
MKLDLNRSVLEVSSAAQEKNFFNGRIQFCLDGCSKHHANLQTFRKAIDLQPASGLPRPTHQDFLDHLGLGHVVKCQRDNEPPGLVMRARRDLSLPCYGWLQPSGVYPEV